MTRLIEKARNLQQHGLGRNCRHPNATSNFEIAYRDRQRHLPGTLYIYLSDRQLGARFGVHHLTIRRWERIAPTFPRSIKLTPGCCRWRLADIEAWEASKPNAA